MERIETISMALGVPSEPNLISSSAGPGASDKRNPGIPGRFGIHIYTPLILVTSIIVGRTYSGSRGWSDQLHVASPDRRIARVRRCLHC